MENFIEEMVTTGLAKPIKIRGHLAWVVFAMIKILAEYKPYPKLDESTLRELELYRKN